MWLILTIVLLVWPPLVLDSLYTKNKTELFWMEVTKTCFILCALEKRTGKDIERLSRLSLYLRKGSLISKLPELLPDVSQTFLKCRQWWRVCLLLRRRIPPPLLLLESFPEFQLKFLLQSCKCVYSSHRKHLKCLCLSRNILKKTSGHLCLIFNMLKWSLSLRVTKPHSTGEMRSLGIQLKCLYSSSGPQSALPFKVYFKL